MKLKRIFAHCAVLLGCMLWPCIAAAAESSLVPALIPWPQKLELAGGTLTLPAQPRIIAAEPALQPLASVLADEFSLLTGSTPAIASAQPAASDIVLVLDFSMTGEAYRLDINDRVTVRGGNYGAVALGTATLLQLLPQKTNPVALPRLSISDEPKTAFRGLLVDVARRYHSIDNLKQIVKLCRLYKVRYLQLHLTDDQSFMFPSKTFPQLAAKNEHGGKTYTLDELKDLVACADARNVTIIPEYEVPGHSAAANRAMRDLFLIKGTKPYEHHASINFAKDEVMQAVAIIVGEMCEVFKSSPYFHIGGDEADLAFANQNEYFQAAFKKYNLPNQHQLYRKFVVDMNEIVKKNGKTMIVWEGFGREPNSPIQIPKDIIVMAYEIRFYMPDLLMKDGYQVVNASWTPLYVVNTGRPPAEIYAWELHQFKPFGAKPYERGTIVPPEAPVFGAQMCAWEQGENQELPNERHRLPAMMERIWNPGAGKTCADYARRFASTDHLLDCLVHRFSLQTEGLAPVGDHWFEKELTLKVAPGPVPGVIRYTLDGKDPGPTSLEFSAPVRITKTTELKARAFSANSEPIGYLRYNRFELHPIQAATDPVLPDMRFSSPVDLSLKSTLDGEIHFTLDGKDPSTNSAIYASPIRLEKSTKLKAALFQNGKRAGEFWSGSYSFVPKK